MTNREAKTKVGIYGLNFITPSAIKFVKTLPNASKVATEIFGRHAAGLANKISGASNPFGALYFGVLDLIGGVSEKVKYSKLTRLSKAAGAAFYGVQSVYDLVSIAHGDYSKIVDLPFDASMAFQLGKDTAKNYGDGVNDLWEDVTKW